MFAWFKKIFARKRPVVAPPEVGHLMHWVPNHSYSRAYCGVFSPARWCATPANLRLVQDPCPICRDRGARAYLREMVNVR